MSFPHPDEINPFEAPRAAIGPRDVQLGPDDEAESIRLAYLSHEASVKSIGSLCYLGAIFAGPASIFFFLVAAGVLEGAGPNAEAGRVFSSIIGLVMLALFLVYAGLGYGLSNLQAWARWTNVVLIALSLLNTTGQLAYVGATNPAALGTPAILLSAVISYLILGYILYLLVSAKGGVVFSPAYKQVIARTPHIKRKMSVILKIALFALLAVLALIVIAAIAGFLNQKR